VFVGTATDIEKDVVDCFTVPGEKKPVCRVGPYVHVRFDVETVYKGDLGNEVVVSTRSQGAACGVTFFAVGERFVVFAYQSTNEVSRDSMDEGNATGNDRVEPALEASYFTGRCSPTAPLQHAADTLEALDAIRADETDTDR